MSTHRTAVSSTPAPVDVAAVLGAGALAPSSHNAQPWRLRWRDGAVEVHGEPARALPVADPDHRELRLACGAAITNVRLAIRAQGRRAHLQLLPDPDEPWLFARVTIGAPLATTSVEQALAHAIPHRRTDRSALSGHGLTPGVREEIRRAAHREHSWAVFVDDGTRRRTLQEIARRAHAAQQADAAFRAEWDRWVGTEDDRGGGLARDVLRRSARPDGRWLLRALGAAGTPDDERPPARTDDPALLVLATTLDQPLAHLQAGQAVQHVLLLGTVRGLAASFVAPPLEGADTPAELRVLLGGALWPQALLRLGVREREVPRPSRRATGGAS